MSRIRRAFERRFRELLAELGAREREKGLHLIFERAERHFQSGSRTVSHALTAENIVLVKKVRRFRARRGNQGCAAELVIFCDAGLGGLARWLRASGYDARWTQDIADAELVSHAEKLGAVVVTTDSLLLERRTIARGSVRAIWVPPSLNRFEQLRLVLAELGLPVSESRCMNCGGELLSVEKQAVRERIPPKTYSWIDQYFECTRCHQLFWQGTHWQRVTARLQETLS